MKLIQFIKFMQYKVIPGVTLIQQYHCMLKNFLVVTYTVHDEKIFSY